MKTEGGREDVESVLEEEELTDIMVVAKVQQHQYQAEAWTGVGV